MMFAKLFRREATVEQATETNDVLDELAAEETRKREEQAERIVRERREGEAYRAKIMARRDNYLREVQGELANVWRTMPETRWHLLGLAQLEKRLDELGDGRSWEEVTGLPFGLADRLSREIGQALAGTRLGMEAYTPGEVSKPIVGLMPERLIRTPRFAGDTAPPPGFSGTWDMVRGEPIP